MNKQMSDFIEGGEDRLSEEQTLGRATILLGVLLLIVIAIAIF